MMTKQEYWVMWERRGYLIEKDDRCGLSAAEVQEVLALGHRIATVYGSDGSLHRCLADRILKP